MRRRGLGLLLMLVVAGCGTTKTAQERATDEQFNEHWRNGGGFHNPNVERKKQGLKPLNFDGSDPDDRFASDMVNMTGGFFWDVTCDAFKRCLLRCLDGKPKDRPRPPDTGPNPVLEPPPPAAENASRERGMAAGIPPELP